MAELIDLGKHCSVLDCQQLDFLPFDCRHCSKIFCKEHFNADLHGCENQPKNDISKEERSKNTDVYKCSVEGCEKTELASVRCSACNVQICLQHRHQLDHNCSKYEAPKEHMQKTKELVDDIVAKQKVKEAEKAPKVLRNAKAQRMAAKVQLMKLKMKSDGTLQLPQEERIYFKVLLPKTHKTRICNTFVSQSWPIGKVIDAISAVAKVENKNNVQGAPKLRLFRFQDGMSLCSDPQKALKEFIDSEDVFNGDCLVLEYIEEGATDVINVKEYSNK